MTDGYQPRDRWEAIRLLAAIVTALGMIILVPLISWMLLATIAQGERLVSLETWRGEGRRYTKIDATEDFGVVLGLIEQQKQDILENRQSIKDLSPRN